VKYQAECLPLLLNILVVDIKTTGLSWYHRTRSTHTANHSV